MTTVDVHAHAKPMPVLEWLADQGMADLSGVDREAPASTIRMDPQVSGVAAGAPLPLARAMWDVPVRIAEMDAAGMRVHAVSLPPFLACSTMADAQRAAEIVRRGNDALLDYVAAAPDRLVALATVPLGTKDAAAEAARMLDAGARGVALGTRGAGCELDDPLHEPLWELLAERRVFAFVHPSGIPDAARLRDFYLPQLVGYPVETAIALARLVFAGVLQRHDLILCLAHGGGCLPWLRGRLDLGWQRKEVAHTTPEPPSEYVRGLYYDTAVFSGEVLDHLVDDMGADRVLLGTDFPFDLADRDPLLTVGALGLSAHDAAAVCGTTALRLLGLDSA